MDAGTSENPNIHQTNKPAPDAGSRQAAKIAWVVGILAFLGVVSIQQGLVGAPAPEAKPLTQLVAPADTDPDVVSAKIFVRLRAEFNDQDDAIGKQFLAYVEASSENPIDEFRAMLLRAELGDAAVVQSLKGLDMAAKDSAGKPFLSDADAAALGEQRDDAISIIEHGQSSITNEKRTALSESHGYFGRLLLSRGLTNEDPSRAPLVEGGGQILTVIAAAILVVGVYAILGIVLMIVFFVRVGDGRVRPAFEAPAPGGSVYLETVALFLFSFVALQTLVHFLPDSLQPNLLGKILLQWLFLLIPLWPLLRGVPFSDLRRQLGLVAPKGLFHEVSVGAFSYFAALPFLALAFLVTVVCILIQRRVFHNFEPPHNPIQDVVNTAGTWTLLMFFLLATMWAPLVEETIFRGALFRHFRGRTGLVFSALSTGLVFGFMHGYAPPLLLPVITLGVVFAFMREWRGSLVASMTAHFIHNFTLLTLSIAFAQAVK